MYPLLLASVIYHEEFFRATLPAAHPLWTSRVFIQNRLLDQLRGKVLLECGECPVTGMKASGIPSHLAVAKEVANNAEKLRLLREVVMKQETEMPTKNADLVHGPSRARGYGS